MPAPYRIFGAELSPYSVKVRSYFRYKDIPHQWVLRNAEAEPEYKKHARIPIIPLVVTPDEQGLQDSTPILDRIEAEHPEPSVHPGDPVAGFVSTLLEEFGDEWGNKWMFHYRWAREVDQVASAGRIARNMLPADAGEDQHAGVVQMVCKRMVDRVWFVGSNEVTAPQIETSFRDAVALLEAHLAERPYLFGARPAYGDFGLWGQLYNAWTDPTPCNWIEAKAPNLLAWIHRMTWPRAEGDFESWGSLEPTLMPFLEQQVGGLFMPWTLANAACVAAGEEEFSVELASGLWTQKPQKYHAKSLATLRAKYQAVSDKSALDPILERAGCLDGLRSA
ncbi:MAG: glutathione S-transferase family protein [Deltaproteobacteria bacterium]|nr:glutathione S-transferase family protein [Deltaproteobacteria bacterium]